MSEWISTKTNNKNKAKEEKWYSAKTGQAVAKAEPDFLPANIASTTFTDPTKFFRAQQQYKQNNPNLYALMGGRAYNPIPSVNPTQLTKEELEKVQTAQAWDKARRELIEKKNAAAKTNSETQKKNELSGAVGWLQSFANDYMQGEKKQSTASPSYSAEDIEYIVSAAMSDDEIKALQSAKKRYVDIANLAKSVGVKAPENKTDITANRDVISKINAAQKRSNNLWGNYTDEEKKAINKYAQLFAWYTNADTPEDAFSTVARLTGDKENVKAYQEAELVNRMQALAVDQAIKLPNTNIDIPFLRDIVDLGARGKWANMYTAFSNLSPESQEGYLRANIISPLEGEKFIEAHEDEIIYNRALKLYNEAINGNGIQRASAQLGIFIEAGIESGLGGLAKGLSMAVGETPEAEPMSINQTANNMLSQYYADNNKRLSKVIQDVVVNAVQNQSVAIGGTLIGIATGNPMAGNIAGNILFGVSVFGNNYEDAVRNGAESQNATVYALSTAALETSLGIALGAIPGAKGFLTGTVLSDISKIVANPAAKFILKMTARFAGESIEEGLQQAIDPFLRNAMLNEKNDTIFNSKSAWKDVGYSSLIGGLSAMLLSGGATISEIQTEKQTESYGQAFKQFSDEYDVSVKDLAKYAKEISEEKSELYKTADGILSGKLEESDYNVGLLYTGAVKEIYDAGRVVTELVGNKVMNTENGISDLIAQYDEVTEKGFEFPDIVKLQVDTVRRKQESGSEVSAYEVGRMARTIPLYAARAAIETAIAQDSELQSTANGGIIENRGDNYVLSDTRTDFTSNKQSAQSDSRGESQNGRIFAEDEVTFQRRVQETISGKGRGHSVKYGNTTFAYVERTADSNSNYGRAAQLLKSAGVKVVVCEGVTQRNDGKTTTQSTEAVTAEDGTVYISDRATLPAEEIVAHELVHVAQRTKESVYIEFEDVICDNIDYSSDAYIDLAGKINTNNFGGKYDIDDIASAPKIMRELSAYINQYVATDPEFAEQTFGKMFKDWGAVVEASKKFNKDMGATSSEAASYFAQNESSGDKGETELTKFNTENTKRRHTNRAEQAYIKKVGKDLGVKVVFEDIEKVLGEQGYEFDKNIPDGYIDGNGTVHVGFNVVNPTKFVLKHELTHYGKRYNKDGYIEYIKSVEKTKAFKSWLQEKTGLKTNSLAELKVEYREMIRKNRGKIAPKSSEKLNEEMYADFSGEIVFNEERFNSLINEVSAKERPAIIQYVLDFFAYLKEKLSGNKDITFEIKRLETAYAKMLRDATINAEAQTDADLARNGVGIDFETNTAFSVGFVLPEDSVDEVAQWVSERTGRSLEDSKEWVKAEQSLATIIYTNAEELDYAADQRYEAIKTNSDYPQGTIDLINLCPKREIYTQMFDALQKIMPNKVFNAVDIANIRQTLSDLGIEVACGLCYVEDRRQLTGEIAQTFSSMWKEAVETGQPLTKTNANGKRVQMHVTKKLATKYGLKQGALIKASGSYIPNQYDLTTYQGFKNLFENEETREIAIAYEAYNNSRGMQAARLIEGRAEYKRQILEWTDDKVKKVNSLGGLRIFSFSDFEAVHLIDMAQVIVDCAARGVKIQGYTKRADFLKLVKNTGIKLNVSHIPKGDTGIKVVNGVKVLDYDFVEGINQKDQNYFYDPNNNDIGNVIVGINDEQIRIAMIDDFIDYIIPFHTNKAKNINDKLGTGKWWNYKNYQVDKNQKTGRKRNINIYTEVLDIYRPKNKTEFVNAFLKVCQNKNMIPRYEQFLNREYTKNGAYIDEKGRYNYVYTEGYHKFLVDFKLFDKSGNIALQREIVPSLDKEYMKSLLEKEVERRKKYEFDQETFEKVKAQFEQAPSLEELKTDGLKKSKNKYDLDFSAPMLEDGVVEEEGDSERDIIEATERISEDYNNGKISREEYRAGLAKLYEEAVKTYGQFPQGEKAVEDIAVPKKVSKSKPVMRFIRTLVESGAFTEDMLEDMSAETLLGNFSYTAVSDESAQEKAEKVLASGKADTEWEEAVIRGQIGKDNIALGEMLLMDAINRNDRFEVLKLSSELADMFTRAGRIVQAARMFKKMTGVGKVVYVNRMVDTLNKSLKEKYGDKFGEGKAIQPIKVDPRLLEELGQEDHMDDSDLYEKNPESVITDIKRNIAEQIPSTWLDKLNAWRYFAMLSNLRTHVRNLIGNVIFAPAVGLKNVVGTVAERTLIRDTNQRTKAVFIAKEYRDFAQKDIKTQETKMMLKGEGQLDEKTQIQQMRRTFETEWLEKLVKGNSNLLEAEDMIFKSIHYKSALASYLQAKKVDLKNIDQKTLDQAREYAVNEAKKATFQDASLVADMINKMFKIPKGSRWEKDDGAKTISTIGQFAVEGILPFKRTPINIVKRGVEYSPIGLTKTLTLGLYNVYKKKITMSEFCDGLASGITGTGIALVGMLTYSLGWISAGFGDDDEDKFKKLNGEQEYAVQVFGKSYSMDWAAPACLPFFIGVELMQEIDKDRNLTIGEMNDAFWNTLEPMLNLSMLSGLQGVIDAVRYEDENKTIASVAGNIATSFGMQLIPSAAGAVGRTIDDTQRTQYVDKNLPIGSFSQGVINDVKSKVPGLSFLQTPSIDAWGRERKRGGVGERVLENFVSPGYYSEIDYDNVEKELEKIYKATGEQVYPTVAGKSFKVGGKNKFLSGKEWEKYAKAKGSMSYNYIKEFMDSKYYDKLNNDERAEVIKDLYSFANEKAKGEVSEYDIFSVSTYKTAAKYDKNNKLIPYYVSKAIEYVREKRKDEKE